MLKADPNLAVLVGNTQSNISTPKLEQTIKSSGYPTPIKYLGLFLLILLAVYLTIFQKSYFASPPDNPPIAYPFASFDKSVFIE